MVRDERSVSDCEPYLTIPQELTLSVNTPRFVAYDNLFTSFVPVPPDDSIGQAFHPHMWIGSTAAPNQLSSSHDLYGGVLHDVLDGDGGVVVVGGNALGEGLVAS
jgi:hypothetical protein